MLHILVRLASQKRPPTSFPFLDVQFKPDAQLVAERMPGFHWMTGYGDYRRELAYALRRTPIAWEDLG